MRIVVALGGNALLRRGEPLDARTQIQNAARAAHNIAELVRDGHTVIVTHGNGPQVGLLALQAEASSATEPYPLDVLGAESEGQIGYLVEQEISNALPGRPVVALLTRVEVDRGDPSFAEPSKPIGPIYTEQEARALERKRGWTVAPDGEAWRRVVPSPRPLRIVELPSIEVLVEAGHLVVCSGGGGIPVTFDANRHLEGVEAVVDKDRSAALLATALGADLLLLVTDVDALYRDWPGRTSPILSSDPRSLARLELDRGSMGPKVEAACRFVEATNGRATIGALEDMRSLVLRERGTQIENRKQGTDPISPP